MRNELRDKTEKCSQLENELTQLKSLEARETTPNRNQSSTIESFGTKIVELLQNVIKAEIESISNTTNQIICSSQDVVPVNGTFAIHVSRALKEATMDDITDLIVSKSSLNAECFKVEKLANRRYKGKNKEFSSFKISTFTRENFDKIMDDNIWKPDCVAKPFIYKDPTMKQDSHNQYESNAPNTNKTSGKKVFQKSKANKNSHVAPGPKNNNNNNRKNNNRNGNVINSDDNIIKAKRNDNSQRFLQTQGDFDVQRNSSQQQSQHQNQQQPQQRSRLHGDSFNNVNSSGIEMEPVVQPSRIHFCSL